MRKTALLSLATISLLNSAEIKLGEIVVENEINKIKVTDISSQELKSADLAEALGRNVASISISRRSGIANDIILRGQKRDNINVLIDGAKVHGACMNRMDPPISHVLTNSIDNVEIEEGPFNVEEFGSLSGTIKVNTLKPKEKFHGNINLNGGSWGYKKASATLSGGNEKARLLISASNESGNQYKDGDGKTLSEQNRLNAPSAMNRYQAQYSNMDGFKKKSIMTKGLLNINNNQELELSYTSNRSDNILYANGSMDALYDDSNIFNAKYSLKDISNLSQKLSFQYYYSEVDHPMSTKYRANGVMNGGMVNHLTTEANGFKVKNMFMLNNNTVVYGVDYSKRNWDGRYYTGNAPANTINRSLDDVDTTNRALFAKLQNSISKFDIELGARYDKTDIRTPNRQTAADRDRDFNSLSANIFATYNADSNTKYFFGVGQSSRVPDARELYVVMSSGASFGTDSLEQTKNLEFDLGVEREYGNALVKAKVFHSKLKNYITYRDSGAANRFENVDAKIYGAEISGLYRASDSLFFDFAMAYQRGKKDSALTSQSGTNLADIPPLKVNLAANFDINENSSLKAELIAANSWSKIDSENGEQRLSGYGVVNLKYSQNLTHGFSLNVGVDNLFDKTYAISNTYKDITLLDSAATDVMLLNEPGRYLYANLNYAF